VGGHRHQAESGQASPEWLGVVFLVCVAFAAMVAAGVRVPGGELAREIAAKLVCVANLGEGCGGKPSALVLEYGADIAEVVSEHVPVLSYEEGMLALPIDYRKCREVACAQGPEAGRTSQTNGGEPVTLFSHVVDCRDPESPTPLWAVCVGDAAGNLYVQYWAYYPDSATAPFGKAGYHPDDWESFQVRIGPGGFEERASSHHGYNGRGGNPFNDALHTASGWADPTGRYWISSGSHAGRIGVDEALYRWTLPEDVEVVPLESFDDDWDEYVGSPDHKPAWLKEVFLYPEAKGTSG
jgi:hypothetical protein